jgi:hypothetical protein
MTPEIFISAGGIEAGVAIRSAGEDDMPSAQTVPSPR